MNVSRDCVFVLAFAILHLTVLPTVVLPQPFQIMEDHSNGRRFNDDPEARSYTNGTVTRQKYWIIDCQSPPLRCVANSDDLTLEIDTQMRPRLFVQVGRNTRISIQQKNFFIEAPELFTQPLGDAQIASLAKRHSFIVIEPPGAPTRRIATEGIDRAIYELHRLKRQPTSPSEGSFQDYKPMPLEPDGRLREAEDDAASAILMRHKRREGHYQLVPADKPQSEFAIRAQGGDSFFSDTGDAGY